MIDYDPLTGRKLKNFDDFQVDASNHFMDQFEVVMDKESMSPQVKAGKPLDLQELADSYRDQVGLEAILRLIQGGVITPESIADDGKHSGDATLYSNDLLEAQRRAEISDSVAKKVVEDLGIKGNDLEDMIRQIIAQEQAKLAASSEVKSNE